MYFVYVFLKIFKIICLYNIFTNCGEKGFKAIIPILDIYTMVKLFYKKNTFIIYIITFIILFFAIYMISLNGKIMLYNYYDSSTGLNIDNMPKLLIDRTYLLFIIISICSLIIFIYEVLININISKCFDKSSWFTLGLVFFNIIFLAILAFFNKNQYKGNVNNKIRG